MPEHNACALCHVGWGMKHRTWCPRVHVAPTHEAVQEAATAPKTSASIYATIELPDRSVGRADASLEPSRERYYPLDRALPLVLEEDEPVAHESGEGYGRPVGPGSNGKTPYCGYCDVVGHALNDCPAYTEAKIARPACLICGEKECDHRVPVTKLLTDETFRHELDLMGFGDLLEAPQTLPSEPQARKALPMVSGLLDYFPAALMAVAGLSKVGNDQHNPGEPLHWARGKSGDEADALLRHLVDRGTVDTDGVRHSAKVAWRALALLQKELEDAGLAPLSRGSR